MFLQQLVGVGYSHLLVAHCDTVWEQQLVGVGYSHLLVAHCDTVWELHTALAMSS